MSLLRRSAFDLEWPSWFNTRTPLEWTEAWNDLVNDIGLRVEEYEKDHQYIIRAEAPGIDPDKDVELTITNGALRLMVHRQKESRSGDAERFRSEFHYGSFTRTIPLPAGATDQDIKATYEDGILEVRVPLNGAQAKQKRIPISTKH